MPPPYCYPYPRPAVTIDLAAFALHDGELRTLLIRRKAEPFRGHWALPGGFLEMEETIEAGARRELLEETGVNINVPVESIGVFGDPGRDPRGRTISVAHAAALRGPLPEATGRDDAAEAAWLAPSGLERLAFDHDAILLLALDWLKRGVEKGPIGLALLPMEFEAAEARRLHRAIFGKTQRCSSWLNRLSRSGAIAPIEGASTTYRIVAS